MRGLIYRVTCIITKKVYIGQTVRSLNIRQIEHYSDAFSCNSQLHFHKALRKYGKDAFIWEAIRVIDCDDCDKLRQKLHRLEKHYIKKYDSYYNGYNETLGGEPGRPGFRQVVAYTIDGIQLNVFSSAFKAAEFASINEDSVRRSCTLETNFVHNRAGELFVFRYIGDKYTQQEIEQNQKTDSVYFRKINVYDYESGQLIDTLYNTIQCATKYDTRVPYVRICCQNKIKYVTSKKVNKKLSFKFVINS